MWIAAVRDWLRAVPKLAELQKEHDDLALRYERLLDSYEILSARFYDLANPRSGRFPGERVCVRKSREAYSFTRVISEADIPRLEAFLRSAGWLGVSVDRIPGTGRIPSFEARGDGRAALEVPARSYVLVRKGAGHGECLVVPEEGFHEHYEIVQ